MPRGENSAGSGQQVWTRHVTFQLSEFTQCRCLWRYVYTYIHTCINEVAPLKRYGFWNDFGRFFVAAKVDKIIMPVNELIIYFENAQRLK